MFTDFFQVYQNFSEFTKNFPCLPTLLTFIVFIDIKIMWFFVPTFTEFIPTFPTVNRKFLITDFRLLLTSVKPKNFIEFYRSKKKMKHPRCLVISSSVYLFCQYFLPLLSGQGWLSRILVLHFSCR